MKYLFKWLVGVTVSWCFAASIPSPVSASESASFNSGKTTAQLVTSHDRVLPGSDIHIALSLRLEKHWHTYWRNAGGPGKPARFNWTLPEGYQVGDIVWPLPDIVYTGPMVSYAFEDRLLLPMSLHIPSTARLGEIVKIEAEALYLVCYTTCVPEGANVSVSFEIGQPVDDARWSANINKAIKNAPKQNMKFQASARLENGIVLLGIQAENLQAGNFRNPYFYPYIQDMIDADDPQSFTQYERGIQMILKPSWKLDEGLGQDLNGVIEFERKMDTGWEKYGVVITAQANSEIDLGGLMTGKAPRSVFFWVSLILIFLISLGIGAILAKRRGASA